MNYYQLMAAYNRWMNRKLYDVCSGIPDHKRREDMGAFFRSIHGTLNHLLFGDMAWMSRFTGEPLRYDIGEDIHTDFDGLRADRENMDATMCEWVEGLDEEWLAQPLEWTSRMDGKTRRIPRHILVTHMFNHQTHHRGQLTTLIKQLGYEPGITDIPWMPMFTPED